MFPRPETTLLGSQTVVTSLDPSCHCVCGECLALHYQPARYCDQDMARQGIVPMETPFIMDNVGAQNIILFIVQFNTSLSLEPFLDWVSVYAALKEGKLLISILLSSHFCFHAICIWIDWFWTKYERADGFIVQWFQVLDDGMAACVLM